MDPHSRDLIARNTISDRGPLYPFVGALTVSIIVVAFHGLVGAWPHPVIISGLLFTGIGIGLVVARAGRLGPFEGILGSPWYESRLNEIFIRELARANRYGRDLSIVAIRQRSGASIDWYSEVRISDQVLRCRDGWYVLILPETAHRGAIELIHRVAVIRNSQLHAAVVCRDAMAAGPADLASHLLSLIGSASESSDITISNNGMLERVPLLD